MAPITEGSPVPDLSLAGTSGERVELARIERGIVYFYPKDMTPGCTVEACSFRDSNDAIEAAGWSVYGISTDQLTSHERFIEKHGLPFELLSDPDHEAADAFGVWTEKSMFGKRFFGVSRTTFAIENGRVVHVWEHVKPREHTGDVLGWIGSRANTAER